MKIKNLIIVFVLILMGLSACMKESVVELGPVYPMCGEWYVTARFDDGTGNIDDHYGVGYFLLTTSNVASYSPNELLVMDNDNFWSFKVKTNLNLDAQTFTVDGGENLIDGYAILVDINNGKVILDGGLSTVGNVTDSIYMEVEYEDDPGVIYQISGVRRTGFLEDEH